MCYTLHSQGEYADAEGIQREVLQARKRVLGPEHEETLTTSVNLAATLAAQGKSGDAGAILHEVIGVETRVFGAGASEHAGQCEQSGYVPLAPRQTC